jgi:hypothetical protein
MITFKDTYKDICKDISSFLEKNGCPDIIVVPYSICLLSSFAWIVSHYYVSGSGIFILFGYFVSSILMSSIILDIPLYALCYLFICWSWYFRNKRRQ